MTKLTVEIWADGNPFRRDEICFGSDAEADQFRQTAEAEFDGVCGFLVVEEPKVSKPQVGKACKSIRRFFELAAVAAFHGGFWVSAGGGTANVIAGEVSRAFHVDFQEAHEMLDAIGHDFFGMENWYEELAWSQPIGPWNLPDSHEFRWDCRTIIRAAIRRPIPDPAWRSPNQNFSDHHRYVMGAVG
jgi:hypothetical protein